MAKRVLVIDDHKMFRWGVRQFLMGLSEFTYAGEASDGREGQAFLSTQAVDIVLLDLDMPNLGGVEFLNEIRRDRKDYVPPQCIILSQSYSDDICLKLRSSGIAGYVLKTEGIEEIGKALTAVAAGDSYFSPGIAKRLWTALPDNHHPTPASSKGQLSSREFDVARLVSRGMSNKTIAERLGCAANTVKTHRANLMRKVGAKNALDLARWIEKSDK